MATSDLSNDSVAYINGAVYTVASDPWASAFIVSPNGIFTHVGSDEEILAIAKQQHLVTVDLKGSFTMPGLHDAHMHLLMSGLGLTSDATIPPDATHLDIASKVHHGSCACEYINVYQNWILASAYSNQNFPAMAPDRAHLDTLFPDRPVVVRGGAGHSMLLNTAGLRRAGYDIEHEPDVPGAKFFRRPDGSLTGEMAETAMTKAALAIPAPSPAHVKRALRHAIGVAHRAGVTSLQEASSNSLLLQALSEMEREGVLKVDVSTHIVHDNEWLAQEKKGDLARLLDTAEAFASRHVDTRFVKMMLDGVPLPPLFTHVGLDERGEVESEKIMVQNVAEAVEGFDRRGLTVKIHCTGQGATRVALDAIAAARERNPNGPRHEIAHNSGVNEDDYKRYAPLNVTAEMSPAAFFGPDIAASSHGLMDWNFPKMQAAGAHITIGSDWGAVPDPSLFKDVAKIVEDVGKGDVNRGGQEVLRMLTINGAMAVGRDKEVGSIEVGKKANFIVVDRDLSKGEFEGAKVLRTYFEGEKVWDARE